VNRLASYGPITHEYTDVVALHSTQPQTPNHQHVNHDEIKVAPKS